MRLSPAAKTLGSITAVILGGGRGDRLAPLTRLRAKPAVPFAGKYRLIDIPISNCINSGIKRVFVLTQFMSASLHRHIMKTYQFDTFSNDFVEILAAQETQSGADWFQGTADAVRATLDYTTYYRSAQALILSGDHLYRMDYGDLISFHEETKAEITVCVHPVSRDEAPQMGLLKLGEGGRIVEFVEKPRDAAILDEFRTPQKLSSSLGLPPDSDRYLASMGVYLFDPDILAAALSDRDQTDFGKEIMPASIGRFRVVAYPFIDYWKDIGTIASFFEANLSLVKPDPPFPLHHPLWPFYTHMRALPPGRIIRSEIRDCLLAEGIDIAGARITESVIGVRSVIREGADLREVVLMGADFYEGEREAEEIPPNAGELPPMGIGKDCVIERAIIDKNARIGDGVVIRAGTDASDRRTENHWVRDGITIIPKGAVIRPGTVL
jgi:glucose-1-phosphate adenylyltransferase